MTNNQEIRKLKKPVINENTANGFIQNIIGNAKIVKLRQIDSYDDANYYCEVAREGVSSKYLVKFYNALDTAFPDILIGLQLMLDQIKSRTTISLQVPNAVRCEGADENKLLYFNDCDVTDGSRCKVAVRIFDWIDGSTLSSFMATVDQLWQVGQALVEIQKSLVGFDHGSFHRVHMWDLAQFALTYEYHVHIEDEAVRGVIQRVYEDFNEAVLPVADVLPRSIIMGDCNDANIIVSAQDGGVIGLIDFSDAVLTWSVNEIAIAIAYGLLSSYGLMHPHSTMAALLTGYVQGRRLSAEELGVLPILIATRLSISSSVGAYSYSQEPTNEYLKLHSVPACKALLLLYSSSVSSHSAFFEAVQQRVVSGKSAAPSEDELKELMAILLL